MSKRPTSENEQPSSSKRSRFSHPFSIENILGIDSSSTPPDDSHVRVDNTVSVANGGELVEENAEEFIRRLGIEQEYSPEFGIHTYRTRFLIQNTLAVEDPNIELFKAFSKCRDRALEAAAAVGLPAYLLCAVIDSPHLREGSIMIPYRHLTEDTIFAIYHEFLRVEQSYKKTSDEGEVTERTLLQDPFSVEFSSVAKPMGNLPPRAIEGHGKRSNVKIPPLSLNINPSSIISVNNTDTHCLFYAVELTREYGSSDTPAKFKQFTALLEKRDDQRIMVEKLMSGANIPTGRPTYDAVTYIPLVQSYYDLVAPGQYKIFVFTDIDGPKPSFKSSPGGSGSYKQPICLYAHDSHFDGIKRLTTFFGKRNYCLECEKFFDRPSTHTLSCKARCINCATHKPGCYPPCSAVEGYSKTCDGCHKTFISPECFERHREINKKGGNFCRQSKKCNECGVVWSVKDNSRGSRKGHKCEERWCKECRQYHPGTECFISKLNLPKRDKPIRYVAYDLEATQDTALDGKPGHRLHVPNFLSAAVVCTECIENGSWKGPCEDCDICGDHRKMVWSVVDFTDPTVHKKITNDPVQGFMDWLLYGLDKDFNTRVFAHCGGKYDSMFVFRKLLQSGGLKPSLILRGTRLVSLKVEKPGRVAPTEFVDSYNLMPVGLSKLVGTFKLGVQVKGDFPHLYNKSSNYNTIIPTLPPKDDYMYKAKKPADKAKFEAWWEAHYNDGFNFNERLAEYCINDTEILLHALVAFRTIYLDITGIDVLQSSLTIASACMRNFRTNHLKELQLALVREGGYELHETQSLLALKYLKWYAAKHKVDVSHRDSAPREVQYAGYKLDGYYKEGSEEHAIEVNGCVWHGCPTCFPDSQQLMPGGKTAGHLYEKTMAKEAKLQERFTVHTIWECEIHRLLKEEHEMKAFFDTCKDTGPIRLRDAFAGGRTGPNKLFAKAKPGWKISYKDFVSLYPFINYQTEYPVGHPVVHIVPPNEQIVNWTKAEDVKYKGMLKVLVLPPQNLRTPVLPHKVDSRLLFPLCNACAIAYPSGDKLANYRCTHSDEDREFVSTCTHMELEAALDAGYIVKEFYRAWVWKEYSNDVFKSYVEEFLKLKLEASGWSSDLKDEDDGSVSDEVEIRRKAFISTVEERYHIVLDPSNMKWNEGIRYIAKLCLNSLWGRFAMRNNLAKVDVVSCAADMWEILNDVTKEVTQLKLCGKGKCMVTWQHKEEFIEEDDASNLVVAIWTTSAARLHLYKSLKAVEETEGAQVLYMDTDSIIYLHRIDLPDPLGEGEFFGEMTDEEPNHNITEFISAGCKNYAYWVEDKVSAKPDYRMKVRGFTLDWATRGVLPYETFRYLLLNYGAAPPLIINCDGDDSAHLLSDVYARWPTNVHEKVEYAKHGGQVLLKWKEENGTLHYLAHPAAGEGESEHLNEEEFQKRRRLLNTVVMRDENSIRGTRMGIISSTTMCKKYRPIVTKGIIDNDFTVLPFGFNNL